MYLLTHSQMSYDSSKKPQKQSTLSLSYATMTCLYNLPFGSSHPKITKQAQVDMPQLQCKLK